MSPRSSIRSTSAAGALEDVLAVVEHEQDRPVRQVVGDALDRLRGGALDAGGVGHRSRHVGLRRHRREVDEHDAVGVLGLQALGDRQGDGGLADAARPGDRHQRGGADPLDDAGDVAVAADGRVAQPRAAPPDCGRRSVRTSATNW